MLRDLYGHFCVIRTRTWRSKDENNGWWRDSGGVWITVFLPEFQTTECTQRDRLHSVKQITLYLRKRLFRIFSKYNMRLEFFNFFSKICVLAKQFLRLRIRTNTLRQPQTSIRPCIKRSYHAQFILYEVLFTSYPWTLASQTSMMRMNINLTSWAWASASASHIFNTSYEAIHLSCPLDTIRITEIVSTMYLSTVIDVTKGQPVSSDHRFQIAVNIWRRHMTSIITE